MKPTVKQALCIFSVHLGLMNNCNCKKGRFVESHFCNSFIRKLEYEYCDIDMQALSNIMPVL